jgi:hypothetical protein
MHNLWGGWELAPNSDVGDGDFKLGNAIGNTRTDGSDERDQGRASTEKGHLPLPKSITFPISSPTKTMPDPTLSIPVPSDDPKPKNKQESEPNDTKQNQKGEKEPEDLVCLSSTLHLHARELKLCSPMRTFSSRTSSKCL